MFFNVRLQETVWDLILLKIEIQIDGIFWSCRLSYSVGSPGQIMRFRKCWAWFILKFIYKDLIKDKERKIWNFDDN